MAASFNEKPIMAGFIKKWSSWSSRRCDCELSASRSRGSTSRDDEGDKGPMGAASNIGCTLPSRRERIRNALSFSVFIFASKFIPAWQLFDGHLLGKDSRWIVVQPIWTREAQPNY